MVDERSIRSRILSPRRPRLSIALFTPRRPVRKRDAVPGPLSGDFFPASILRVEIDHDLVPRYFRSHAPLFKLFARPLKVGFLHPSTSASARERDGIETADETPRVDRSRASGVIGIVIVPSEHGDGRCLGVGDVGDVDGAAEDGDGDERGDEWTRGRPREDGGGDVPRARRATGGDARDGGGDGGRRARRG